MSNAEKISEFLAGAGTFLLLTADGDQPKGRPFGFQLLDGDRVYFATGTFKDCFRQLTTNPRVEVLAYQGNRFLRYDGTATLTADEEVLEKVRAASPQLTALYDENNWEFGVFYLENGHAEFRTMMTIEEEFDV